MRDAEPDYGGDGWRSFRDASVIRNRLSHPKRPEHLVVSADDIETVEKAMVWFMVTFLNLMPFSKLTQEEMGMLMAHAAKV